MFEASEELAAEMGFFPTTEDGVSDEEFLSYPGTYPAGFPQDDPIAREMWKQECGDGHPRQIGELLSGA